MSDTLLRQQYREVLADNGRLLDEAVRLSTKYYDARELLVRSLPMLVAFGVSTPLIDDIQAFLDGKQKP